MKTILFVVLFVFMFLFYPHYHTLVPRGNLPVGYVIQAGDLDRGWFGSTQAMDLATDPHQVIGHKVLKPIPAGSNVHLADVSQ